MASDKKLILIRTKIVYFLFLFATILVAFKMYWTMDVEGEFWRDLGYRQSKIIEVLPNRGNILACDGKLLATSVPTYVLHMDFKADGLKKEVYDSLMPMLSDSLARFYGVSPKEMRAHIDKGYKKGARYYRLNSRKLSYVELKQVEKFPLFDMGKNKSGLTTRDQVARNNPFRPLSLRTVGSLYAEQDKGGKCGIENYYDSILKGTPGSSQEVYVGSKKQLLAIEDPIEGKDVMTTLDVDIMDITDNALRNTLERVEAAKGCVVVMEVATGQIKAMSNLKRMADGSYEEVENYAVNSKTEPGSTFKIASAIVALEDGVDTSEVVDTENGVWRIYGHNMRDWNYNKGGFGKISLNRGIQVSSNIVIAKIIEEKYKDNPMKYIEALYGMGLNTPLDLELNGVAKPFIKNTDDKHWSKMSLAWIAHGYELTLPPINLLTFYNGIANNGKMIRPYLVKGIYHNGRMMENKERITVINDKLCSDKTLKKVQQMMVDVVEYGTATSVRSDYFKIAGKTGTAVQTYDGARRHQLTFCGYFPADDPKYSIIVVVWYPSSKFYPSAGAISGEVFKNIAERLYAVSPLTRNYIGNLKIEAGDAIFSPATKDGNYDDLVTSLGHLGVDYVVDGEVSSGWCRSSATEKGISIQNQRIYDNRVPNVVGMGAKDAVFLMENRGLVVKLEGVGAVTSQSIEPGIAVKKGTEVKLELK